MRDKWADNQAIAEGSTERCQVTSDRDVGLTSKVAHSTDLGNIENILYLGWPAEALTFGTKSCGRVLEASAVTGMIPSELDYREV